MSTAMIAMTTSSSMSVKARRGATKERTEDPFCRDGQEVERTRSGSGSPPVHTGGKNGLHGSLGPRLRSTPRQAGLLAYGSIEVGRPSRGSFRSGRWPGLLAEYSSGPAPDSHRLPFSLRGANARAQTCREVTS